MATTLNLLVIRAKNIDHSVTFYETLGLSFTKHRHGKGPEHYASETDGFVFEIYPLTDEQQPTTATRIGFAVDNVDSLVSELLERGAALKSPPKDTEWGHRAVLADLDGHAVELITPSCP